MFAKLNRYGREFNTHDGIKLLAIITMIIDHAGLYFFHNDLCMRLIGRMAAPLFFFLVGFAGYRKPTIEFILFGILLTIGHAWIYHTLYINILINFILIRAALRCFEPQQLKTIWLLVLVCILVAVNLETRVYLEYGTLGFLVALGGRLMAENDKRAPVVLVVVMAVYAAFQNMSFGFYDSLSLLIAFSVEFVLLTLIMCCYRLRIWPWPRFLLAPSLVLARYSLEVYFIHLAAFMAYYAYCLG